MTIKGERMVRVAIAGINGRMGTMVSDIVLARPDMELVAGFDLSAGKQVGPSKGLQRQRHR